MTGRQSFLAGLSPRRLARRRYTLTDLLLPLLVAVVLARAFVGPDAAVLWLTVTAVVVYGAILVLYARRIWVAGESATWRWWWLSVLLWGVCTVAMVLQL